jgi:hypothetical protein
MCMGKRVKVKRDRGVSRGSPPRNESLLVISAKGRLKKKVALMSEQQKAGCSGP